MSNPAITDETALLIVSCAAAIHQQLYLVIDLLNEQARVLKRLVGKRIRPTNDERRRLAALARKIERRILEAQELLVTVDTFRRWHRQLIAATYSAKQPGRPRLDSKTEALIVQMATDNPVYGAWVLNLIRAQTAPDSGFLNSMRAIIMDRDLLFTTQDWNHWHPVTYRSRLGKTLNFYYRKAV